MNSVKKYLQKSAIILATTLTITGCAGNYKNQCSVSTGHFPTPQEVALLKGSLSKLEGIAAQELPLKDRKTLIPLEESTQEKDLKDVIEKGIVDYVVGHKEVSEKKWKYELTNLQIGKSYIPEKRQEVIDSYTKYFEMATKKVFQKTRASRVCNGIEFPQTDSPIKKNNRKVLVVNQLVDKYSALIRLENKQEVKTFKTSFLIPSGLVGYTTSKIKLKKNGIPTFKKHPLTVLCTSASTKANFYISPIEETLHRILRSETNRLTLKQIKKKRPKDSLELQEIIDRYMAIEEGFARPGSIVIMKELAKDYDIKITESDIQESANYTRKLPQYIFQDQGAELIKQNGFKNTFNLYMTNLSKFIKKLKILKNIGT